MPNLNPSCWPASTSPTAPSLDGYRADGGYEALEEGAAEMTPAEVVDAVKDSGLRGRGGAGFPCGLKWTFLPKDHPGPIYLCVNADESEPCTFNNRILMEEDPHQVLEGIMLACYAIRAHTAYFYIRYEYGRSLSRAASRRSTNATPPGCSARTSSATDFNLDIYLHRGAGAYICGEETGLIESLEGKRAWPRIKPPFPAVEGAFRKPTSSTTSKRWPASRTSSTAASTGSSRSACRPIRRTRATPAAMGRSSTASAAMSISRAASSCRWASRCAS